MKNLWHKFSEQRKFVITVNVLFFVAVIILTLCVLSYRANHLNNTTKPSASAQELRIRQHNQSLQLKRFPDLKPNPSERCHAFGLKGANRATYFECYTYDSHLKNWRFSSSYGYIPDYIK